jgi:hypothetical protein
MQEKANSNRLSEYMSDRMSDEMPVGEDQFDLDSESELSLVFRQRSGLRPLPHPEWPANSPV